jgi:hypothetical protein
LQATITGRGRYDWHALTRVEARSVAVRDFHALCLHAPRVSFEALNYLSRELAMLSEHITCVGRRAASARVAYLLLELWYRLRNLALADDKGYALPVPQEMIADTVGITPVHVSRALSELRSLGALSVRRYPIRYVDILDIRTAHEIAGFESDYTQSTAPLASRLAATPPRPTDDAIRRRTTQFRKKAEELRMAAQGVQTISARDALLSSAQTYELLAETAEFKSDD